MFNCIFIFYSFNLASLSALKQKLPNYFNQILKLWVFLMALQIKCFLSSVERCGYSFIHSLTNAEVCRVWEPFFSFLGKWKIVIFVHESWLFIAIANEFVSFDCLFFLWSSLLWLNFFCFSSGRFFSCFGGLKGWEICSYKERWKIKCFSW